MYKSNNTTYLMRSQLNTYYTAEQHFYFGYITNTFISSLKIKMNNYLKNFQTQCLMIGT